MFQSRDEVRQVYLQVWVKMQDQSLLEPMEAIIAEIIQLHPEYHPLLQASESAIEKDYSPEEGQTNPFLHMGMHISLREQSGSDRPAGIQGIYQKLVQQRGRTRRRTCDDRMPGRSLMDRATHEFDAR